MAEIQHHKIIVTVGGLKFWVGVGVGVVVGVGVGVRFYRVWVRCWDWC